MPFGVDLRERRLQPEVMDQPGLDPRQHAQALRGLRRINRLSGSAVILWPSIRSLARRLAPRPLRVLDVATGGGDVPVRLWQAARAVGLPVQIDGCDRSPMAVAFARNHAAESQALVGFFICDALEELPTGYDVLVSSLFLHHLDEDQAVRFLRRMADAAGRLVLINDLVRSTAGYLAAYVGTRLLSASPIVREDGPRSVAAAFTLGEARALAERAGLRGARVVGRWPWRFLLRWRRP
ncbi:MAG TPA: methyltransferase domain-containing protein [Gemmataceae bacterium]|jgi:2-polyprenyl-3-methyl-5-hydroxy-6-metoxy-1,4-benzoquinol methylase|nr:methyltransferase domain-containing protein [Gemmataceae bacterium]